MTTLAHETCGRRRDSNRVPVLGVRARFHFRCKDVAAVDINMGCPKSFSISGGMGTALLTKQELLHDVCGIFHYFGEWGDKSQIATIGLAADENLLGVVLGGIL
ncbi:hypothetical protein HYC85_026535 [Camellia sinensis]|uniref:GDT1 family protein n=1 Tax=Camellia sinensis TaxID=4442 RepID=A0A7J7G7W1_CAMSI|nr:hypothetical protein HYC85_026535 [Camellia sinensis]